MPQLGAQLWIHVMIVIRIAAQKTEDGVAEIHHPVLVLLEDCRMFEASGIPSADIEVARPPSVCPCAGIRLERRSPSCPLDGRLARRSVSGSPCSSFTRRVSSPEAGRSWASGSRRRTGSSPWAHSTGPAPRDNRHWRQGFWKPTGSCRAALKRGALDEWSGPCRSRIWSRSCRPLSRALARRRRAERERHPHRCGRPVRKVAQCRLAADGRRDRLPAPESGEMAYRRVISSGSPPCTAR